VDVSTPDRKQRGPVARWSVVLATLAVVVLVVAFTGRDFASMRRPEVLVPGPGVTDVAALSDYLPSLAGTPGDTEVFVLEGTEPGGTTLVLGGVHPNEVAGVLAAVVILENAEVSRGRVIVIPRSNASGFTHTETGFAAPQTFDIPTAFGTRTFRYGARLTNPLHQYPDPDVHVHHPSGSLGSGKSARNLNRNFPGRADGTLTERIAFAIAELIREERVDLVLDMHEARPMNPIVNAVVTHADAAELTSLAILSMQALEGLDIRIEPSAEGFHGVSHRELGEATDALATLSETPQVAMDYLRGSMGERIVLEGRDAFMARAADHGGLVYVDYDPEVGYPIDDRVGRHVSIFSNLVQSYNDLGMGAPIDVGGVPYYADVVENGVGAYLRRPPGLRD
jgi:hypothetical protein